MENFIGAFDGIEKRTIGKAIPFPKGRRLLVDDFIEGIGARREGFFSNGFGAVMRSRSKAIDLIVVRRIVGIGGCDPDGSVKRGKFVEPVLFNAFGNRKKDENEPNDQRNDKNRHARNQRRRKGALAGNEIF